MDDQMKQIVAALKPLFEDLRAELEAQGSELRAELEAQGSELRAEFAKVNVRLDKVESGLSEVQGSLTEVKGVVHRTAVKVASMEGDVAELKRDTAKRSDLAKLRSEIEGKFDGFAKIYDDLRFSWASHTDILGRHEKRMTKLEARRA